MMERNYNPRISLGILCATAFLFLNLSGCATLGKDECLNADWFSIGYEDGARGYKASRIAGHRKACAKHGVAPDFDTYEKGRQQGLGEWCTPRNGYRVGAQGGAYNGVCPAAMEPAYLKALNQGKAVYGYEKELKNQDQTLKKLYTDLDGIDRNIADMEAEMVSDRVSPRRRKMLLEEIRMREGDRRSLLDEISAAEQTIADMQRNLEQMRARDPFK